MSISFSTLGALLAASFYAGGASAQFSSEAMVVSSLANDLFQSISAWSSPLGVLPAFQIQQRIPAFQDAVNTLYSSPPTFTDGEVDITVASNLVSSVVQLLSELTAKQPDFDNVSLSPLVASDISAMQSNAVGIAFKIVDAISTNCPKVSSLAPSLEEYASAFAAVDSAYGVPMGTFPSMPKCVASSSAAAQLPRRKKRATPPSFDVQASSVISLESFLAGQVAAFNSSAGLLGAYNNIAAYMPGLIDAVVTLSTIAGSITDTDVEVDTVNNLVAQTVSLLMGLVQKVADFEYLEAASIIPFELSSIQAPAVAIAFSLVDVVKSNCDKVSRLSPALTSYQVAFDSIDDVYTYPKSAFPSAPVCVVSSSAPSSSVVSSPAATSVASTLAAPQDADPSSVVSSSGASSSSQSAPASTAPASPAPASTAPASSAPASSAPTSSAPASSAPASSAPASSAPASSAPASSAPASSASAFSAPLSAASAASAPAPSSASSAASSSICYAPAPFRRRRKRDTPSDFDIQASSLAAIESDFAGKVSSWNLEAGLGAAYSNIQASFPDLSNAVMALHTIVGSITDADVDVEAVNSLVAQTVSVLNALTQKAAEFGTLGAADLVRRDLTQIQGPAVEIGFSIVAAIKSDCAKVTSLAAALSSYEAAFNSVDAAYSLATSAFPDVPVCNPHPDSSIIVPCGASTSAAPSGAASSSSAPVIPSSAASGIRNTTSDGTAVTTHVPESSTTVTKVQTVYTTVCPASTTFTANGNTYTGTPGQTITVRPNKSAAPPPAAPSNPAAAPPVANGAATHASSLFFAALGAMVILV